MKLLPETENLDEYLLNTSIIDYQNRNILETAGLLMDSAANKTDFAIKAFEFVRDKIKHIIDCHGEKVIYKASDVLLTGYGFCYAKSNLLAAILRSQGIPAGFCYQKLWIDVNLIPKLVIHGLNGIYLENEGRWIRVDARGNKPGVDAQFSIYKEKLAFPARKILGEIDYPEIYTNPSNNVTESLNKYSGFKDMIKNLPETI